MSTELDEQYAARETQGQVIVSQLANFSKDDCYPPADQLNSISHKDASISVLLKELFKQTFLDSRILTFKETSELLKVVTSSSKREQAIASVTVPRLGINLIAPQSVLQAVHENRSLFVQAALAGHNHALRTILSTLQGENPMPPLLLYKCNILEQITGISRRSKDAAYFGHLPTIIPNVDARYYYPPLVDSPQFSLLVTPLDQPRRARIF